MDSRLRGNDKSLRGNDKSLRGNDKSLRGNDKSLRGNDSVSRGNDSLINFILEKLKVSLGNSYTVVYVTQSHEVAHQ